jgi:diguanylate cyclase (GGDEF)-like protein
MFKIKLFFKSISASGIIILSLLAILLLTIYNSFFVIDSIKTYKRYDSALINKFGRIRGNIQRYVKLKIANEKILPKYVEETIENDIKYVSKIIDKNPQTIPSEYRLDFFSTFTNLKEQWKYLKNIKDKKKLISFSEKLWNTANFLTFKMQKISEYKIKLLIKKFAIAEFFTIITIIALIYLVYKMIRIGLEKETITDNLTGLYNRLFFNEQLKLFIEKYKRYKEPFSMMLFDIDNFKKINDTYGHNVGDEVLKEISKTIKSSIRKTDLAFRYGGEEFAILFPKTHLLEAYKIADRLKETISKKIKIYDNPVTISGSVGEYKNDGAFNFIQRLDYKLYEAKRTGKNKILKST